MHLAGDRTPERLREAREEIGFDSVTNYVLLPYWKGKFLQDYSATAERRAGRMGRDRNRGPDSVRPGRSPGWDSSPRAADFGAEKPRKYPGGRSWIASKPDLFREALRARSSAGSSRLVRASRVVFV